MIRVMIITTLFVLALAGATAGLATADTAAKNTDRLSYRNVTAIVLNNTQGHIHVTAGHSSRVIVQRTTQTLFTNATSSAYLSGHVLYLNSRCDGTVCQVDFVINTPKGVRLELAEKNAEVSIDGSPGDLDVTNTGSGDLTLDLAQAPQRIRASTHHGAVAITVPRGRYAVVANAANGNKTITGITIDKNAAHVIRALAGSGDVTISGR